MDLCLGTVQFGLKYGISGNEQPDLSSCIGILDYAYQNGINTFDTASAYGIAEEVVGEFVKRKKVNQDKIKIISKISPDLFKENNHNNWYNEAKQAVTLSIKKLNVEYLDGYMLHNSSLIYNDEVIETLNRLKLEGLVKQVGTSIYKPEEAIKSFDYRETEIIQIPYNIFDQRLNKSNFFDGKLLRNRQVFARSAFLQGLLIMPLTSVPSYLAEAVPLLQKFENLCNEFGITRAQAAISYVKSNNYINYLVFGVDNLNQIKEIIDIFSNCIDKTILDLLAYEFVNVNDHIVMPNLWNK